MDEGFLRHWRRVGHRLEEIRRRELCEFRWEDHWAEIDELLEIGLQHAPPPPDTSGLVEWTRLIAKSKR